MKTRTQRTQAFSLIEVVIAIGIVAFVVTAVLGLLELAAQSNRSADVQAASAAIVSTVIGELSSQNFSSNVDSLPYTKYFTLTGGETNSSGALYRCNVSDVSMTTMPTNYVRYVRLLICWPAPVYNQTNTFVGSFAQYD